MKGECATIGCLTDLLKSVRRHSDTHLHILLRFLKSLEAQKTYQKKSLEGEL